MFVVLNYVLWLNKRTCKDCKFKYIGKTSRNLHVCFKEHKRDIRIGNSNNALFLHISQYNHIFDFNSAKMITYIHNKNLKRIFEAAAISFFNSLNTRPGFYNISPYLSKYILNSYFLCFFFSPSDSKSFSINKHNKNSMQYS